MSYISYTRKRQNLERSNVNLKVDSKLKNPANNHFANEANWIGVDIAANNKNKQSPLPTGETQIKINQTEISHFDTSRNNISERSEFKMNNNSNGSRISTTKSPTQLVQDILKGLNNSNLTKLNPFYEKESEDLLVSLLTDKHKLNNYIKKIEEEMAVADPSVVKNYEILVILLQQASNNQIQVKQSQEGLEVRFNKTIIEKQQHQIQKLEKELKEKEQEKKQIIQGYEAVIRNINEVMERLISNKEEVKGKNHH